MNDMCLKIKTLLPFQGVGEKQTLYPGRCPGLGANWAFSPHYFIICTNALNGRKHVHDMHKMP